MFSCPVEHMAECEGIIEALKANQPMAWAGKMNARVNQQRKS